MPLPAAHALRKLGRDLALARRKRGISTADMAGRLFVSRDTLWRLERGDPTVSLGTLATAAFVLQLHDRLASLAAPGERRSCSQPGRAPPAATHSPRPHMSWEVHIEWQGQTCLVGRLHAAERGPAVSFEYAPDWLKRPDAFAIDPTSLPLQTGAQHSPTLFGAISGLRAGSLGPNPYRARRPQEGAGAEAVSGH